MVAVIDVMFGLHTKAEGLADGTADPELLTIGDCYASVTEVARKLNDSL